MLGGSRLLTRGVTEGDVVRFGIQSGRPPSHLLYYAEDKKPVVVANGIAAGRECEHATS
jgi:Fe-coproporphyrin III synthase